MDAKKETKMAIENYADEVMADGPVGYWRLGQPPGSTTAADSSGNGHTGEVRGGVTFGLPGFHGGDTAALFDGATGRIIVPNKADLNPKRITMEAKVRWDGPTNIQQRILEKESFAGTTQYGLSVQVDGRVLVELRVIEPISGTMNTVTATSNNPVAIGTETHVVATYDGLAIRIYLNGRLDIEKPVNTTVFDIDIKLDDTEEVALAIGDRVGMPSPPPHRTFNGLIDEVAIFPTPLSEERIRAHYQAQFAEQTIFQYAAKVVCGKSAGKVVAPGAYFTAVNVHNPTYTTIGLRVKVAVALPGLQPGPVSKFYTAELGPDEALEIDCPDIFNPEIFRFPQPLRAGFLKGFVVIESEVELDVVAVYTAVGRERLVATLHTERVPARTLVAGAREV